MAAKIIAFPVPIPTIYLLSKVIPYFLGMNPPGDPECFRVVVRPCPAGAHPIYWRATYEEACELGVSLQSMHGWKLDEPSFVGEVFSPNFCHRPPVEKRHDRA